MQYSYELYFSVQGRPSEQLVSFVSDSSVSTVIPSQTIGGNLSSNVKNCHQLSIRLPLLKKHITFSASDDPEVLKCNMVIYNLACSLNSFLLAHSLSSDGRQFIIHLTSDDKKSVELLKAIRERFEVSKKKKEEKERQKMQKSAESKGNQTKPDA